MVHMGGRRRPACASLAGHGCAAGGGNGAAPGSETRTLRSGRAPLSAMFPLGAGLYGKLVKVQEGEGGAEF